MFEKIDFIRETEDQNTKSQTGTVSFTNISFEFEGWQTEDQKFSQDEESFDENENYFGEEDEEDDFFDEDEQEKGEQETLRNVPLSGHDVLHQHENLADSLNSVGQLGNIRDEYVIISYSQPPKECDTVSTTSSTNSDFHGCRSFYYSSESSSVSTSVSDLPHDDKHAVVRVRRSCLVNRTCKAIETFHKKTVRFNTMANIIGFSEYHCDEQDASKTLHEIFMERRLNRKLSNSNENEVEEHDPEQEKLDLLTKDITNRNITITKLTNTFEKFFI